MSQRLIVGGRTSISLTSAGKTRRTRAYYQFKLSHGAYRDWQARRVPTLHVICFDHRTVFVRSKKILGQNTQGFA